MYQYRVSFNDGTSITCSASCESDAKFIACNKLCRTISDIVNVSKCI